MEFKINIQSLISTAFLAALSFYNFKLNNKIEQLVAQSSKFEEKLLNLSLENKRYLDLLNSKINEVNSVKEKFIEIVPEPSLLLSLNQSLPWIGLGLGIGLSFIGYLYFNNSSLYTVVSGFIIKPLDFISDGYFSNILFALIKPMEATKVVGNNLITLVADINITKSCIYDFNIVVKLSGSDDLISLTTLVERYVSLTANIELAALEHVVPFIQVNQNQATAAEIMAATLAKISAI